MEVLHGKLLQLENVARKADHKDKDKFTLVLSRFVAHRGKPSFAASLMLTLLRTKEEAAIYEKEQKMIKWFGDETQSSSIISHVNTSQAFFTLIFSGPLKSKTEEEKVSYLLLWVDDKGRDIRHTWTDISAEDGRQKTRYILRTL